MPTRTYTYDSLGRMLTASENGGIWTQGYDALSRRVSQSSILGTMTSGYDLAGRRTQLTWPDGFFVNYDYNLAGNLDSVRENGATNWQLANWYYDNLGRKVAQGSANGALSYWAYDGAGRLSGLTHDLPGVVDDLNLAFTYNPAGQIISRTMSNQAYAYAPAQGVTSYVNNGKNQLTNVGGDAVSYDAKGNITQIGGIATQTYDGLNRLTAANTTAGWVGLYYDPLGRLARSIGSTDVMFFYDGGRPIAEYNSAGALTRRYIPGLAMDETLVAYEGASPTDRRWLLADERLSVVAYTDGAAGVLARNTYDEYGQPGAGNGGLFQYTGQMWMPQAQLYHYKARAYAPQMGRFMQTDPIGYGDGANVYGYVGGDPVNFRDPLGREGEHLPGGELQCSLRGGFVVVTVSDTVDHNECHFPSGFLATGGGAGNGAFSGGSGGYGAAGPADWFPEQCTLRYWGQAMADAGDAGIKTGVVIFTAGAISSVVPGGASVGAPAMLFGGGFAAVSGGMGGAGAALMWLGGDPRAGLSEFTAKYFESQKLMDGVIGDYVANTMASLVKELLPEAPGC